jgi:hypothetical protein
MARTKRVTKTQAEKALALVAAWMGPRGMTLDGSPAPSGKDAADQGMGPQLIMDWDWPGDPTPTILLEGGPYDWAIEIGSDIRDDLAKMRIWSEPYAGYALCLHRLDA